ncbi:hypothetical protein [Vibrio parahaemolyticus]|uniref:hypothetical protein n=1 Tax=Vibrio parahaemolyticus TaxID=670 RepID=UPI00215BA526|nr:hypothetical protein [Vibrio parahaemolyticus]MCR9696697.1 hypothetical protein [Vibrio parahaemolyticus]MCR9761206.1 hypothetical protein [Vibrio parahaemolyticus]
MKTLKKFALFCVFCLGALVTVYQSWGVMLMAFPSVIGGLRPFQRKVQREPTALYL